MKNSELYKLAFQILACNKTHDFKLFFRNKIVQNEELLSKFIFLCSNHLILPAVFRQFSETGISEILPNELSKHLHEILILNIERNKGILKQIEEISYHLWIAGIEPVYLKGTANLLDNLYSDISDRMIGDIDFLVKEDSYLKTAEVLKKIGYSNTETEIYDEFITLKHYPRLYRDDVHADIEIHRIPVNEKYAGKFGSDIIFEKKIKINTIPNCYVTCDEHKLIHTFIHSQLSNRGYINKIVSLRDLYDFYLITNRVNFYSVLPEIEEKNKAIALNELIQLLYNISYDEVLFISESKNEYLQQVNWLMNHPIQHRMYINFFTAIDMFVERPFYKIKNMLLYKNYRKSVFQRLKDPYWYKSTYYGIKSHFK